MKTKTISTNIQSSLKEERKPGIRKYTESTDLSSWIYEVKSKLDQEFGKFDWKTINCQNYYIQ